MIDKELEIKTIQEQIEGTAHHARAAGRRAFHTSLGFAGLAFDGIKQLWNASNEFVDRAEHRGEEVEADVQRRVRSIRQQISTEANQMRTRVDEQLQGLRDKARRMKADSGAGQRPASVEPVTITVPGDEESEPFAGYDALNVDEVVERLSTLDSTGLHIIRAYEEAHKNRVTVLRAIDARLDEYAQQSAS